MNGWAVTIHRDGEQVAEEVPVTDWDAAGLIAPVLVAAFGGPISIGQAVATRRIETAADECEGQASLFEEAS